MADMESVKKQIEDLSADTVRLNNLKAHIELEEAQERFDQRKSDKKRRANLAKQYQVDLATQGDRRRAAIERCSHRQGTGLRRDEIEQGGSEKSPSALRGNIMPDGRRMIMCSNCPLRVWEPRKADGFPKARRGETDNGAKQRVAAYNEVMKNFERLWKHSQDQLTREAGQPMHCGVQFDFSDQNGQAAHVPSPCDSYVQGLDNSKEPPRTERAA